MKREQSRAAKFGHNIYLILKKFMMENKQNQTINKKVMDLKQIQGCS